MKFSSLLTSTAAACFLLCSVTANAQDKPLTNADVEAIVEKTIQEHPELIVKSVEAYQMKQQAEAASKASQNIVALQGDLKNNPDSPSIGNQSGDVTVVEFFDYHCGYCKHFFPVLTKMINDDKGVRVVFKEFPILSEDSGLAAKAALAVNKIDKSKYFAFHTALMKSNERFTMEMLTAKAKEAGIDPEVFKNAMQDPALQKEIDHNKDLAQQLNISGTPALVIGTQIIPGAVEYDTLKTKIADERNSKK